MYGKSTIPMKEELVYKIIGKEEVITCRPADLIDSQLETARNQIKVYMEQEEDVLSYALFPQVAHDFFRLRETLKYKIDFGLVDLEDKVYGI